MNNILNFMTSLARTGIRNRNFTWNAADITVGQEQFYRSYLNMFWTKLMQDYWKNHLFQFYQSGPPTTHKKYVSTEVNVCTPSFITVSLNKATKNVNIKADLNITKILFLQQLMTTSILHKWWICSVKIEIREVTLLCLFEAYTCTHNGEVGERNYYYSD